MLKKSRINRLASVVFFLGCLYLSIALSPRTCSASQRIAILPFEDKSNFEGPWDIVNGIPGLFGEVLAENPFYSIVPAESLATELNDRRSRRGKFSAGRAIAAGENVGADYAFTGRIQAFSISRFKAGVPIGGYSSYRASVELEVRIFKVISGREEGIITGEGDVSERSPSMSYRRDRAWRRDTEFYKLADYAFGSKGFKETLIGEALMEALAQLKEKVENVIEPPPMPQISNPAILWVEGDEVYVNIGIDDGTEVGDKFGVYSEGEELRDPATGKVLGRTDERRVGTIQIIALKASHLSKARIVEGEGIKPGDMVRAEGVSAELEAGAPGKSK